jgi:CheY-like chemotaxis protein
LSAKNQTPLVALVVDDSMLIRHTVCRFLEERGYSVESATNGEEALPIALRIHPDIIPIVIVAGKNSGFDAHEHRANFAIFKDIDIEAQLSKALEALLGSRVTRVKAAGK